MTKAKERYKRFSNAVDGFIINNPVLSRGLGIASIVVASGTLKNAVALSLAFFIVVIPTLFFASLMKDRLQSWIRAFVYAFIASIFYPFFHIFCPLLRFQKASRCQWQRDVRKISSCGNRFASLYPFIAEKGFSRDESLERGFLRSRAP